MVKLKKIIKKYLLVLEHFYYSILNSDNNNYGEVGYFVKNNPITTKYTYANWGSRLWELKAVETWLTKYGIKDKKIVDIGIGLPSASNFYNFYVKSGCYLKAYDIEERFTGDVVLSDRCVIFHKSSDNMEENPDNSVDVVVALSSLEHYPLESFKKTILEVQRILKPGGLFLVTLDLTFDKKSAPWAILEKTLNGLPEQENSLELSDAQEQLTLKKFIDMLSSNFYTKDTMFKNDECKNLNKFVYSKKWNSRIAYIHLYKK